jgi:hypothetical protein
MPHLDQLTPSQSSSLRRRRLRPRGFSVHWAIACCLALALLALTASASAAKDDLDLVSRASGANGADSNGFSDTPAISADGRFVAFHSVASNLDPADGDTRGDIFLRDMQANATTLVSRASGAAGAKANASATQASVSADGRFVSFSSSASNLDPAANGIPNIFVRDLQANTTTLVSRASGPNGAEGDSGSSNGAISTNGRFVVFDSIASNLTPDEPALQTNVFVRDLQTNTTTLVSRASGATGGAADSDSQNAAISADGRFVTFVSFADNLDPASPVVGAQVYVRDLQANTTTLVSRASGVNGGRANGFVVNPVISADGRFVAFQSGATNLDPADPETGLDVFVRDLQTNTTTLVSRATGAAGAKGNNVSLQAAISADGRYVAFESNATNLDPAVTIGFGNVFVRDLQTNTTTLASRAAGAAGLASQGTASRPAISGDGRYVAFDSTDNLDPADGDRLLDVYRRDVLGPAAQAAARISINDVSLAEGDAGQTAFRFTVSLDQTQAAPVTVDFATANGTATAPSDYTAANGTLTFAPGETAKAVTVQVNGDTIVEPDETFTVNLTNASGNATIADAQGTGTIANDDQMIELPSRISINDVTTAEGNAGQTAFRFTVSLDRPQSGPVTVGFTTGDGTATAPSDYAATNGTVTFAPGETTKSVTVLVNGDTTVESDETFTVNLANAAGNATIADAQGVGTIANDDQSVIEPAAHISVNDVTMAEGNAGQTAFRFTVLLDRPESAPVTVDYATRNGTAIAPGDYAAAAGTVTFAPGETAKTVTVLANGDTAREPDETFTLNLANATGNATIADVQGVATIVNDDRKHGHNATLGGALNGATGRFRPVPTILARAKTAMTWAMRHR